MIHCSAHMPHYEIEHNKMNSVQRRLVSLCGHTVRSVFAMYSKDSQVPSASSCRLWRLIWVSARNTGHLVVLSCSRSCMPFTQKCSENGYKTWTSQRQYYHRLWLFIITECRREWNSWSTDGLRWWWNPASGFTKTGAQFCPEASLWLSCLHSFLWITWSLLWIPLEARLFPNLNLHWTNNLHCAEPFMFTFP